MTQLEAQHQKAYINLYKQFNSLDRKQNIGDPDTSYLRYGEKSCILYDEKQGSQNNEGKSPGLNTSNAGTLIYISNQLNPTNESQIQSSNANAQSLNQTQYLLLNTSQEYKRNFLKMKCQHLMTVMYCTICNRKIQSAKFTNSEYQQELNQSLCAKM